MAMFRSQHDAVPRAQQRVLLHQLRLQVLVREPGGDGRLHGVVLLPSLCIQVNRAPNEIREDFAITEKAPTRAFSWFKLTLNWDPEAKIIRDRTRS